MTLLALLFMLATSAVVVAALFFGVPALMREVFQNRMAVLAARIEEHLAAGRLRRQPYTQNLRDAAYFYARRPGEASLRTVWLTYQSVTNDGVDITESMQERADFLAYSNKAEQFIAEEIERELADLCTTNCFRNTIFWLPLLLAPTVLRHLIDRHDQRAETFSQVETVLTHRGHQPSFVAVA